MKKFLSVLLCAVMLVMAFSLVACDKAGSGDKKTDLDKIEIGKEIAKLGDKTPQDLYADALNKVKGLKSYEMTTTQLITMKIGEVEQTVNQTVISKMDGKNVYAKIDSEANESLNMECWYVNDVFYLKQASLTAKATIAYDDYVEKYMPAGSTADGALMNIPEAWFKDVKFVAAGEGQFYIEFIVSSADYLKYFETTALKDLMSQVEAMQDISYKVYFDKEGNLGDIITTFDMTVSGLTSSVTSTSKITGIDSTKITAPEGSESWQDVTGSI